MTAPIGAVVGIYIDLCKSVAIGDIIRTGSGRGYQVVSVRIQLRGKHAGRQHLRVLVIGDDPTPAGSVEHTIRWYKRGRSELARQDRSRMR